MMAGAIILHNIRDNNHNHKKGTIKTRRAERKEVLEEGKAKKNTTCIVCTVQSIPANYTSIQTGMCVHSSVDLL